MKSDALFKISTRHSLQRLATKTNSIKILSPFLFIATITMFGSCSGSPEKNIINRWAFKEISGDHASNHQKNAAAVFGELEFLKDGVVNIYSDGNIVQSTKYTLATDGQSLLLQDPSGREKPLTFKVVKIGKKELNLAANLYNGGVSGKLDTMIFIAK